MSSPAQTSDLVAVPFTERQMNAIHSALLSEVSNLRGLLEASTDAFVANYLHCELAEATQTEADFRDFWRNAVTTDALGGE
jgi:hypothetical protein